MNERPRRRERLKKEEQTTVITETKIANSSSQPTTQTKGEVNYSHTVTSDGPNENGIEEGHKESERSVEEEKYSVEGETPVEEQQVKVGTQFNMQVNGEKSPEDGEPAPQDQSTESKTVLEHSKAAANAEEETSKEDQTEDVELTPEVVEKIEDVDTLERLVRLLLSLKKVNWIVTF